MDKKRLTTVSKFLSKHLRHEPERLGLVLAAGGWVPVADLLAGCGRAGFAVTREELDEVVRSNDKQRFEFDPTGTLIRANQGHSVEVDLALASAEPPDTLYHGTPNRNRDAILRDGLCRMARHHVHLSPDEGTAVRVAARHGRPLVFAVDAARMARDGFAFFVSANGVWLVDRVPPQYLRPLAPT